MAHIVFVFSFAEFENLTIYTLVFSRLRILVNAEPNNSITIR